ncbi:hypothetical protein C9374_008771 [Naegleria lovaniensis]|uniref:Uncharacterized protein n=1 Tax=Naegleria lovaniensis TaxID=51637 RepID=A0AA88KKT3_NAELO|nr:uncharacterized protein C9374_008771 [Naegleria lovaniensis]KAG2378149.1 hypothetical protein C9374_008771 [Naegleria lovaniensis]
MMTIKTTTTPSNNSNNNSYKRNYAQGVFRSSGSSQDLFKDSSKCSVTLPAISSPASKRLSTSTAAASTRNKRASIGNSAATSGTISNNVCSYSVAYNSSAQSSRTTSRGSREDSTPSSGRNSEELNGAELDQETVLQLDDDTLQFISLMKRDMTVLHKKLNDFKGDERGQRMTLDDFSNMSQCIFHHDCFKTKYYLLEMFLEKIVEMQYHLLQKTDRLIPVSKRFKVNNNNPSISSKLQKFIEVADRIVDVVDQSRNSFKVQTLQKETQTGTVELIHKKSNSDSLLTSSVDSNGMANEKELLRKQKHELEEQTSSLSTSVSNLTEKLMQTMLEKSSLEEKLKTMSLKYESTISNLNSQIESLKTSIASMSTEKSSLAEKLNTQQVALNETVSDLNLQIRKGMERIQYLEETISGKDKELEILRKETELMRKDDHLQEKYSNLVKYNTQLEIDYKELMEECNLVKESSSKNEALYENAMETLHEMQESQKRLTQELSLKNDTKKLQYKLEMAEKIAMQKEFQYEELVKEYQILSIELGIHQKQNENLKDQIKVMQKENQRLSKQDQIESDSKQEIALARKECDDKVKSLNEKIKELQFNHVMQLQSLNDTFIQERKMMQRKADKFKQRCDLLEARLNELEQQK